MNDLEGLVQFLERAGVNRVGEVSLSQLERYQAELDHRGYTGSTRKRKTISIRSFFAFLYHDGFIANDISRRLIPPYSENTIPRVFTQAEYQRLLSACAHDTRDTAIIELMLQTGIRLSELIRLTIYDIDLPPTGGPETQEMGLVRIVGGGGRKSRNLSLNSKACQALQAYLQTRPDAPTGILFINKFGTPLGPRGVQKLMQKYLNQAGIRGASVHSLRHTFGTHHAAKGTNLKTIQEVMGHQDIRTTEIYISLAKEMQRKELQEHALI
jgi:site-specific recombinase XerD